MKDDDETIKLWPFALATYKTAGVADACLALQDRFGADVNLLLFAAWAGSLGFRLTADEAAKARDLVSPWHDEIVKPLRAIRKRMKSGPAPGPNAETEALRNKLK